MLAGRGEGVGLESALVRVVWGGLLRRQVMFLVGAATGAAVRFTEPGSGKEGQVGGMLTG